jgi:hypothetical protein
MPISVSFVPDALVVDKTVLAPRVTDAELWISESEFIEWFFDAAPAADFGLGHLEQAFYRIHGEERRA